MISNNILLALSELSQLPNIKIKLDKQINTIKITVSYHGFIKAISSLDFTMQEVAYQATESRLIKTLNSLIESIKHEQQVSSQCSTSFNAMLQAIGQDIEKAKGE